MPQITWRDGSLNMLEVKVAATAYALALLFVGPGLASAQPASRGFVNVPEGRLHYEVAGAGEAVVLLHDGLTHSGIWDGQFARLAHRFRVVRYDRRGHGRSDVPVAPYSPVEDLRGVLDHLEIDRAVLVGASSGGRLALDFALARPDDVSGLVLVGPVVSGLGYSEHFVTRGRDNMAPLSRGGLEETITNWVDDPYLLSAGDREARRRLRALMRPYAEKRFLEHDPGMARPPRRPALGHLEEIAVPTLLVVGTGDIPDVHAHAGAIEAAIDGSERIVVDGAGHLVAFERPEVFNELLLDFLDGR